MLPAASDDIIMMAPAAMAAARNAIDPLAPLAAMPAAAGVASQSSTAPPPPLSLLAATAAALSSSSIASSSSSSSSAAPVPIPAAGGRRTGCRDISSYTIEKTIGAGTFGTVALATDPTTGGRVALKRINFKKELHGFPIAIMREIKAMRAFGGHPNFTRLLEVVTSKPSAHNRMMGDVFLCMEFVDHDLSGLIASSGPLPAAAAASGAGASGAAAPAAAPTASGSGGGSGGSAFTITPDHIRSYMHQILTALAALHAGGWVHRDLKTANILVTRGNVLKLADFGLSRCLQTGSEKMTHEVCTLWYRAPELMLHDDHAGTGQDVWAAGCIFGELWTRIPVFCGSSEAEQIKQVYGLCGVPTPEDWPDLKRLGAWHVFRPKSAFAPQYKPRFGE